MSNVTTTPRSQIQQPQSTHRDSGLPFGHVPSYLPGSASLVEELDERLLVVLRDGTHLLGTLVSYDQYSNMVLSDTVQRQYKNQCYFDIPLGMYIVRGDSVVLTGSVVDDDSSMLLRQVTQAEFHELPTQEEEWDFDNDLVA